MTEDDFVLSNAPGSSASQERIADVETVEWAVLLGVAGRQVGPYRLIKQIGRGGMGAVYQAEQDEPIHRQVALKIINPGTVNDNILARFDSERNTLALMDHPNIAHVLDAGLDDEGHPYFVMELVPGLPITEYCDRHRLGVRERARLMVTVCRAVQHAHQKGIIHRDIKPSNVLIMDSDGKPVPKIIDFGVAKAVDSTEARDPNLTAAGFVVGTPLYMSPEQAGLAGCDIDTRSDVYSLGVLLFELLTGTTPITDTQFRQMAICDFRLAVGQGAPSAPSVRLREQGESLSEIARLRGTAPRTLVQAVQHDLDQIVCKATAKDRNQRYPTANGLARDIERHLDCLPIEAVMPSALRRFLQFTRRYRGTLAAICAVACLLVAATVVSVWQAYRTDSALRAAELLSRRLSELLYASDVKVASDAWKDGDPPRVADLLARHIPSPGEEDHRRFEWHYLSQLVHVNSLQIGLATDDMEVIRSSPDGNCLAAGDRSGTVRLYDAKSLKTIATIESEQNRVNDLAFSPDSKTLATAGQDGTIRLWDLATRQLRRTIPAHAEPACGVVYAAEGTLLVSCGLDKRIRLWDPMLGTDQGELAGHDRGVEALAVSPDGWMVASAGDDGTLRLWDLKERAQVHFIQFSNARMVCVAFSQNGEFVAAGDIHGNVILHERSSAESRILVKLLDGIESLVFLEDDGWLATGDRGGSIQLWPVGSDDGSEIEAGRETFPRWRAHRSRVTALALAPDGLHLVSGSRNGRILQWPSHPENCRWVIGGTSNPADDFAFHCGQSERMIVAGIRSLELWDLARRERLRSWGAEQGPWLNTAVSADRNVLVAGTQDGTIVAWRLDTCEELASWPSPAGVSWENIVFSPDGHTFAAVAWDQSEEVWLFDLDDPAWCRRLPARQSKCAAFSPDGQHLAVVWMDDALLYDLATYRQIRRLRCHSSTLSDLAFSPDGNVLATVGHDRKLWLWDTHSGSEKYSAVAHQDWVRSVAFSPDGWSLATGGDDGLVRMWHAKTGQLLLELPSEGDNILKVRCCPLGRCLACRTANGRIVIYDSRRPDVPAKLR